MKFSINTHPCMGAISHEVMILLCNKWGMQLYYTDIWLYIVRSHRLYTIINYGLRQLLMLWPLLDSAIAAGYGRNWMFLW